jgi:hypothetical protein
MDNAQGTNTAKNFCQWNLDPAVSIISNATSIAVSFNVLDFTIV